MKRELIKTGSEGLRAPSVHRGEWAVVQWRAIRASSVVSARVSVGSGAADLDCSRNFHDDPNKVALFGGRSCHATWSRSVRSAKSVRSVFRSGLGRGANNGENQP